jgi:hypothetical protein
VQNLQQEKSTQRSKQQFVKLIALKKIAPLKFNASLKSMVVDRYRRPHTPENPVTFRRINFSHIQQGQQQPMAVRASIPHCQPATVS